MSARVRVALLAAVVGAFLTAASTAVAAPAAPSVPDLVSSSDSGTSSSDNVTSDSTPTFTVDAGVSQAGMYVTLYTQTGSGSATQATDRTLVTSSGIVTVTAGTGSGYSSALADATYNVTAKVDDGDGTTAGTYSNASTALSVQVDTAAPTLASPPTLVDFVGSSSTVTFTQTPRFDVIAASGTIVTIYEGSTALGSATATTDGSARITVTTALADGSHSVYATGTDPAGNASGATASVTITVDSSPATAGTPDLLPADDDGDSTTDNYTTNPRPHFTVATEANARVTLYEDGVALGSASADSSGVATAQVREALWLDPGEHCLYAIAMDSLANAGAPSSTLCITIAPGVAPFTTNLGVTLDGSDLAVSLIATKSTKVTVKVVADGRVVAKVSGRTQAGKRTTLRIHLKGTAGRHARYVVVTTLRTASGTTLAVRRVVRR